MPEFKRVHLLIRGRVQGISYREAARVHAEELNIKGWIRNNPDGTVECIAEGEDHAIRDFVNWCWKGPLPSKVQSVSVNEEVWKGEFGSFEVL